MTIENNGEGFKKEGIFKKGEKRNEDDTNELLCDYLNIWVDIGQWLDYRIITGKNYFDSLPSARTFEEFLKKYKVNEISENLRSTDPKKIQEMNELVDEYNKDLDRIKREKDAAAVKKFIKRAEKIAGYAK